MASYDLEVTQTALFGEVSFAATDKLSFTAGARWFEYEQDVTLRQGALLAGHEARPGNGLLHPQRENQLQ